MARYIDAAWFEQVRRMRRVDPIYKPALLLVVIDLIERGIATPAHVPLEPCLRLFDDLLVRSGLIATRGSLRGYMPAWHASTSSSTLEPFWELLHAGQPLGAQAQPSSNRALVRAADALRILGHLRPALATADGCVVARSAVYRLLEDDRRPDCLALLKAHDEDEPVVEADLERLKLAENTAFRLDEQDAGRITTVRQQVIRDRSLRLAVLPAYDYNCALCSTRIRWNNLFEVEAAHIKPRALHGADDPRNAMSLCQTHHWAFDLGLWTATDELEVLVRRGDVERGDDLEALRRFEGSRLRMPDRASARPHPEALRWHRQGPFSRNAA